MKSAIATAIAIAAIGASAQITAAPSTVTEYYDDCSTLPEVTVTGTITDLYCDICTGVPTITGAAELGGGTVTTYTTVYSQTCSTGGFTDVTYTVTESCSSGLPESRAASYVPSGFTTTTVPCGCEESTAVVLTVPVTAAGATETVQGGQSTATATLSSGGKVVTVSNGTAATTSIVPFIGAASSTGMSICAGLAALVGAIAFAL